LANSHEAQQLSAGINWGVIFLLFAPFVIVGTFFVMVFRHRIPEFAKECFHFAAVGLAGTASVRKGYLVIMKGSNVNRAGPSSIRA